VPIRGLEHMTYKERLTELHLFLWRRDGNGCSKSSMQLLEWHLKSYILSGK